MTDLRDLHESEYEKLFAGTITGIGKKGYGIIAR